MTAAIVAICVVLLAAVSGLTWSIHRISQVNDKRIEAERAIAGHILRADRADLELKQMSAALLAERRRSKELEAALAESLQLEQRAPSADLAPDDVATRLQRRRAASATVPGTGGAVRAVAGSSVPGDPAA